MKKKLKLKKKVITFLVALMFLIISFIMFHFAYYIYYNSRKINYYNGKQEYSYITPTYITKPIAEYKDGKFYLVTDKNNSIFCVYIKNKKINKIEKNKKNIYGYPVEIDDNLKNIIIKDYNKTLSLDEKVNINEKNYYKYTTKYYLDSSVNTVYKFNYIVFILMLLFIIFLFICVNYLHKRNTK